VFSAAGGMGPIAATLLSDKLLTRQIVNSLPLEFLPAKICNHVQDNHVIDLSLLAASDISLAVAKQVKCYCFSFCVYMYLL